MVKFSKSPLQTSLLKLESSELTRLACNCFIGNTNKINICKCKYFKHCKMIAKIPTQRNHAFHGRLSLGQKSKRSRLHLLFATSNDFSKTFN